MGLKSLGVQGFPYKIAKRVTYFEFYRIAFLLTRLLKICPGDFTYPHPGAPPSPLKNFGLKDQEVEFYEIKINFFMRSNS